MQLFAHSVDDEKSVRRQDPLLTPFAIKRVILKNRIISTSHASGLTEGDFPQERYQRYHEEKAIGGIAMSMFGGSSNVGIDSPSVFRQINMGVDEVVPHLQQFSARMHAHGTALMCQLTHMGRRGSPYEGAWLPAIAPSARRETLHRSIPREMTERDIHRVIRYFGQAASRCRQAGLDGLETLAGGHLLGQFLSPSVNVRTDRYGGSLENRCRFILRVHEEIRKQVGEDFVVGIRYAIEDGLDFEESVRAAGILERSGLFDFFNVVYGRMDTAQALITDNMPTMSMPSSPWLQKAAAFKKEVRLPVFHAAKIADLATARYAISEGLLDLVGMTRAHMADPHLVRKLMEGREHEVRPCVGASFCRSHETACIHNPSTGRETWLPHEVDRSPGPCRKVVVVGAGPAGLEAARVAALRGHEVVLLEAGSRPGGQVLLAALASWRKDILGVIQWRVDALTRLGVDIRLNSYADAADVTGLEPDTVIVATGGIPWLDELEGHEHCLSVVDALTQQPPSGGEVLVYDGTGRHNAYVCAERHALAGRQVTLVTLDGQLGMELGGRGDDIVWRRKLTELGVHVRHDLRLISVSAVSGRRRAAFVHELTGATIALEADHVVVELGVLPVCDVYDDLKPASVNDGELDLDKFAKGVPQAWPAAGPGKRFELYRIGDAHASRDIHASIYEAFRLCRLS
ncbi:2,4-dienoyl-CoA reductase [Variovorax sp. CF079]|uniref:oxidoreductase n=1 Tax=Variovorax sp. CF079 TaxID=1882774 RepID=UPI00088F3847|nr:FAD-dependent oxidoreductase [Variovorax sp. CF079]SDD09819.1 2,4-dienoyl-CoA reductase [Variovorax sp. CF079]